jgi:predicted porin
LDPRFFWGTFVKRTFISAAAVLAFAAAGHADELSDIQAQSKQLREQNQALTKRLSDLEKRQKALETTTAAKPAASTANPVDSMAADLPYKAAVKAAPPINDDMCWHGICLYGNFDMGLVYINHSAPFNAMTAGPLTYLPERNSLPGAYFGAGANMLSTSFIGLRGKQEVGDNLYAVFNLQTLYNPASGMNSNGAGGTLVQNNGLNGNGFAITQANSYGDSSKGGQMFNNVAYFGISSPVYGTFTMGRQSALSSDLVGNYDALSGSNAWSAITFEGATGGGGVTENRIYDNSYEYRLNVGPVRFAAEVQAKNGGNSSTGNAFEGDIGFDYLGFSMDFVGGRIYDALSASPLSSAQVGLITTNQAAGGNAVWPNAIGCSLGCVSGVISDNTVFAVGAKYTVGPWKLYGGYENIHYNNPNNPLLPGAFAQGGYNIGAVNNLNYMSTRVLQVFWAGVKYSITPTLDIAGAYYGYRQNSFLTSGTIGGQLVNPTLAGASGALANGGQFCSDARSAACSGQLDMFSLAIDWRFARHFDFYAGIAWTQKANGLASGSALTATNPAIASTYNTFNKISVYDPGMGLRYQF